MDFSEKTIQIHAVKTQLYRWFTFYEREMNRERTNFQLELLDEFVSINSMGNSVNGHSEYQNILAMYHGTKNSHNLISFQINSFSKKINCNAQITFQSVRPDNSSVQIGIDYQLTFSDFNKNLPKFEKIEIKPISQEKMEAFHDSYPKNRIAALMHFWLFNIEIIDGNSESLKELLASNFMLYLSENNTIDNLEKLEKWVKSIPFEITESNHFPTNFKVKKIEEHLYELHVDFIWRGTSVKGQKLKAVTNHKWIIEDNINERFAKIQKMFVKYEVPFSPLEA
ncbi:hypothetical protein [Aureivirga marina]|uniref:hypothetical protein n=1 Tax=Aureivirga marina TaxID=1182451 RepID=UPI0018CB3BC4|nr:hypothetical protein [Aureivirga marina]